MTITELIRDLEEEGIEITVSGGNLRYTGPEESITPELLANLKKYKVALIRYYWPKELKKLMPINPEGTKKPFFIVHGDNSNYIINKYFGKDQPLYGFFHPGSEGEGIPYKSVEEMASSYLKVILAVDSSGPYYLIGYSFGGVIAYEIAVQLQKAGHNVPYLVLVDSLSPNAKEPKKRRGNIFKTLRYNYLRPLRRKIKRKIKLYISNLYLLVNKPIPVNRRSYYMWERYLTFTNKYNPLKFNGDILLFRTAGQKSPSKYLGWETLVNNIRLVEIDGKHLDIFKGKNKIELFLNELDLYLKRVNDLK